MCPKKTLKSCCKAFFSQNDQTTPENVIDWQYVIHIIWMKRNKSIHIRSQIKRTRKTGGMVWNRIQQEFENVLCQIEEDIGSSTMANHECAIYAGSMTHLLRFSPSPKKLASRLAMLGVSTIAWHNRPDNGECTVDLLTSGGFFLKGTFLFGVGMIFCDLLLCRWLLLKMLRPWCTGCLFLCPFNLALSWNGKNLYIKIHHPTDLPALSSHLYHRGRKPVLGYRV